MVDFGIIGELPVPATYGRHLLRLFEPDKLLAGTGLTAAELEQPGRLITVRQALQYVRNTLNLATEADWYLGWSSSLADHFHGPVSIALLSAPTLGHGMDAFLKHFPSRIPYMHMQGRTRGSVFMAELVPLIDLEEAAPLLIETPLLLLQQHLDNVYGVDFSQASLELAYPPTPHAARYSQYFKCPIHFDAEHNALVFPTAWRELANLGYIESTWAHALSQCRATVASSRERETLGEVRERLCAAFECAHRTRPLPTLNELADRLHLAPRTLIDACAGWGIKSDAASGHNETSYVAMRQVSINGCGTASASTMPSAASTPLARNSGAGRTRARTQSPPKRPAAMAPLKLA